MGKNYVYRMDHDTGFAPNTSFGKVSDEDIKKLKSHLSKKYEYGVYGEPNNPEAKGKCERR
jgi:hypothetical protein